MPRASGLLRRFWLPTITAASLGACAHYQPRPIALPSTAAELDARSLFGPELARAAATSRRSPSWPPERWDLQALTAAALVYNPDLESARASWAVARAGLVTAGQHPNPAVGGAGPGFNTTTDPNTVTPWILTLDLDFTIETAGKRGIRIARATRLSDAARFQVAAMAWRVRAGVREALLDVFSAARSAAVLAQQRAIQEANLVLFQRQLDAGAISTFDMAQARLLRDSIRLAQADAERQRQDARARLATAVGVPLSALDGIELGFDAFTNVPAEIPGAAARRQALVNRADILGALSAYDAAQASLQLEIARQYPDVHLGPGYQMDQADNKWTLLLFPGFLPVFHRNQGPIAEAEARRAEAAAQVTSVQARVIGAVDRALTGYRAAIATLSVAERSLDEVRTLEQVAETQLAAGEISQLDLGVIRVELAARELSRLQALVEAQRMLGTIEDAMQRPADLPVDPLPGSVP